MQLSVCKYTFEKYDFIVWKYFNQEGVLQLAVCNPVTEFRQFKKKKNMKMFLEFYIDFV